MDENEIISDEKLENFENQENISSDEILYEEDIPDFSEDGGGEVLDYSEENGEDFDDEPPFEIETVEEKIAELSRVNAVSARVEADVAVLVKHYCSLGFDVEKAFETVIEKYPNFVSKPKIARNTGRKSQSVKLDLSGVEEEFLKRNPEIKNY